MSAIFLIPVVYFAALLEACLAPRWEVRGIVPDLLALVAFAWLAEARSRYAFLAVGLVGLVSDLNASAPLGIGMGAFAMVGYLVIVLRRNLHLEGPIAQLAIVGFGTVATCGVQGIALRLIGGPECPLMTLVERTVLVGLYTSAIAIPLVMMLHWLKPKREPMSVVPATT
jgi:rod shape-determining protein MreD